MATFDNPFEKEFKGAVKFPVHLTLPGFTLIARDEEYKL
jgi:hypothetical protein